MSAPTLDDTFRELVEPLRRELTAHCYRMCGSVHDAEDLVQETYLRAWRAFHGFENRSSVRTWMYRIATNTCLTALGSAKSRPLPTGLGQPSSHPRGALETNNEVLWLEPVPDSMVWGSASPDPAAETVTRDSVRLAFVAALQHLTAQQRAVVIMRDVLAWSAAEAAEALEISVASVNSSLQRARAHLAKLDPEAAPKLPADDAWAKELVANYAAAFEAYDVDRIVSLLTADAVWEMPPFTGWYSGNTTIGELIRGNCPAERAGDMKMVPTAANGQPALALYMLDRADGIHKAFQIHVLTLGEGGVSHVGAFFEPKLFATFGLPEQL